MTMKTEELDELLKDCQTAEDIFSAGGLVKQFVKSVIEYALVLLITLTNATAIKVVFLKSNFLPINFARENING